MTTVIIPQKMSGTGSIHDTASDLCDRELHFNKTNQYAIVLAAYYGRGVAGAESYHRSLDAAVKAAHRLADYSLVIIDDCGNSYFRDGTPCNGEQYQTSRRPSGVATEI